MGLDRIPEEDEDRPEFVARRVLRDLPPGAGEPRFALAFWVTADGEKIEADFAFEAMSDQQITCNIVDILVGHLIGEGLSAPAVVALLGGEVVRHVREHATDAELAAILREGA